jgi:hypothetical protein
MLTGLKRDIDTYPQQADRLECEARATERRLIAPPSARIKAASQRALAEDLRNKYADYHRRARS